MRPYRRFGPALTDKPARLGFDAVRYTFIVVDFHQLLRAGLPTHLTVHFCTAVATAQSLPAIHRESGLLSRWQKVSSCSKLRYTIVIFPASPVLRIVTLVPRARPNFSSSARVSGSREGLALARVRNAFPTFAPNRSTSRTVIPCATTRSAIVSGSLTASKALACPAEIAPATSSVRVCSGKLMSRKVLAM